MSVFSGATGKIIGPKGAKIQEIKRNANVKDIKMPAKNEDGTRPKAREPVDITIIGKPRAITKARELIQEVVDEWVCLLSFVFASFGEINSNFGTQANAPRPGYQAKSTDLTTGGDGVAEYNSGGGDGWNNDTGGGADNSWENGGTAAGGDNSWETGGAAADETGGGTQDWASASADNW
jgi:hypothetical protein